MTNEALITIIGLMSVLVNLVTLCVVFPRRYSLAVTVGVFLVFTVAIRVFYAFVGAEVSIAVGMYRGFTYIPILLLLFRGRIFQTIFAFFLVMQFSVFQLSLSMAVVALFIPYETGAYYAAVLAVQETMHAGYLILVFKFGRRLYDKLFADARRGEWALYSFGGALAFAFLAALQAEYVTGAFYIMSLFFVCWSFIILCFAIINTHDKSQKIREADFARNVISTGRDHYQKMDEMHDQLHILRHDYKFHLNTARAMLRSGDSDGAEYYLTDIEQKLSDYEVKAYCPNSVINALVASYAERCAQSDIELHTDISILNTLRIPNYELCIILANLLENAVEACEKLQAGRKIELAAKSTSGEFIFMVRNSFNGTVYQSEGKPVSDKTGGGFGLRSIQAVAARYGGDLLTEWDRETFTAFVTVRL